MQEHRWVLAVVWRCVMYALSLGICFFGLVLAFCLLSFLFTVPDVAMIAVLGSTLIGLVGGANAGLYSPPASRDARFLSSFIKTSSVGLVYGAISGCVCDVIFWFFLNEILAMAIALLVAFVVQMGGAWHAINKMIRLRQNV